MNNTHNRYTIREAAKLSGLPESTLRYYETIGLIHPIKRDTSSKHRVYSEDDVNYVIAMACLNATGMSLDDMRSYMKNRTKGNRAADEQVELLAKQKGHIVDELYHLKLRQQYIDAKIAYWNAVKLNKAEQIKKAGENAYVIAKKLKLPGPLSISK